MELSNNTNQIVSETELFWHFLVAPIRDRLTYTALVPIDGGEHGGDIMLDMLPGASDTSILEGVDGRDVGLALLALENDEPNGIECELELAIAHAEALASSLTTMLSEFRLLKERTATIDDDISAEDYRAWSENPRYVLPMVEQKAAA